MTIKWIENVTGVELPKDGELCWVSVGMKDAAGKLNATDRVVAVKCNVTAHRRLPVKVVMFVPLITQYDMADGWPIEPVHVTHFAVMEKPEGPLTVARKSEEGEAHKQLTEKINKHTNWSGV